MRILLFFKAIGHHSLYAVVGAAVVLLVFLACVASIDMWEYPRRYFGKPHYDWQWTDDGAQHAIRIIHHRREDADVLTITGTVKNVSTEHWNSYKLDITVFAEGLLVHRCKDNSGFTSLDPGETKGFLRSCDRVDGGAWPDSLRYEVSVSPSANKADDPRVQRQR